MKKSVFNKKLSATGKERTVNAEIIVTMNYHTRAVNSLSMVGHSKYPTSKAIHKIECFVNGTSWAENGYLDSETQVLLESKKLIESTLNYITKISDEKPEKSFTEKMLDIFD